MSQLTLSLFGSPKIEVGSETIEINRRKATALLAYLAVTDQGHSRDALATLFWPEASQSRARKSLRSALWALNKSAVGDWLAVDDEAVTLQLDETFRLDVAHFRALLTVPEQHNHPAGAVCPDCLEALTEAVSLYQGDFMAGFTLPDAPDFDEWQFFQSESLRQALSTALESLIHLHSAQGDFGAAIPHARRHLALDPLHEAAHRTLMRLYAQSGQQAAALRQYQLCLDALEAEFGLAPSEETVNLCEQIRTGRLGTEVEEATGKTTTGVIPDELSKGAEEQGSRGAGEFLSIPSLSPSSLPPSPSAPLHNLPQQATPFIGRERELADLAALLTDPPRRLVTILGPGGIGKTRLALEAGSRLASEYRHGVYFASLVPLRSSDDISPTIAKVIAYPLQGGQRSSQQQVLDYLREKQMLLVLDNFEHLLDSAPTSFTPIEFLTNMLETAPGLKILVTSRERLQLSGETVFHLDGLAISCQWVRSVF